MGNKGNPGAQQLFEQLKQVKAYSQKCRSGYGELESNLNSLYGELDCVVKNVPMEGEGLKYHEYHNGYKSSLKSIVEKQLSKYDELDSLVSKVLSGSVAEGDVAETLKAIDNDYQAVLKGSINVYAMVDSKHDASKLVNGFYLHLADGLKIDILPLFDRCVNTLKKYFLPENIDEQIGRPQEAMPQAA